MEEWFVPQHMKALANQSVQNFVTDQRGVVAYQFDQWGFRTNGYHTQYNINIIGNSLSFGLGLKFSDTYGALTADSLGASVQNFSFGGYLHENHDHLSNIQRMTQQFGDDIFIVQFNNLDRRRIDYNTVIQNNDTAWCLQTFVNYFDSVDQLLKNRKKIYLYWDNIDYGIPKSIVNQITVYNKCHLDRSLDWNPNSFGAKSHKLLSKIILAKLKIT